MAVGDLIVAESEKPSQIVEMVNLLREAQQLAAGIVPLRARIVSQLAVIDSLDIPQAAKDDAAAAANAIRQQIIDNANGQA